MKQSFKRKILLLDELVKKVKEFKREGKVVVQSHGVYDLIHPGVLNHLNQAKAQGDVLIVTIIKDKDVRRGPGRPIFNESLRAENVASISIVDYVCVIDDEKPYDCLKFIQPDIFAKGQTYKERDKNIHKKIYTEEQEINFGKTRIYETKGISYSSSGIINDFMDIYPPETRKFLKDFAQKYSFSYISEQIESLKKLKILLIGDGIIDEYHYCTALGRASKANIVVNKYLYHEVFAGGAFAIANHLAGLCDNIHLVSLLGVENSGDDFIRKNLKPNITEKFFYRDDGPTIVKKRYLDQYFNQKIFEVNYLNENYIDKNLEKQVVNYLEKEIGKYDIVLISDFGHGLITNNIIQTIQEKAPKYAVNTQTNGANLGYNLITKYNNPYFVCLDESEVRLAAQERYKNIEDIAGVIASIINSEYLIVTRGKKGSIGVYKNKEINRTPIFSTKVIDTVGAGDAFFAFTAPCVAINLPIDLVSFIGNAVGALAVQIICNKKPVEKHEFFEFIHAILK